MADVLFASHSAELAGAERSLLALVDEAAARGHAVTVWVPADGPLTVALRSRPGRPVDVRVVANHWWMSRRGGGLVGAVRLAQVACDAAAVWWRLRSARPDVVVVNSAVAPAAMYAAAWRGIPVVTVVRESVRSNPTLRSLLPKDVLVGQIARRSSLVVAVSAYVASQLGTPSVVIHPPVSPPVSPPAPPAVKPTAPVGTSAHRSGGPQPGALRAVIAGTLGGDKGQSDAVAAVAACRDRDVPVTLDVFGAGTARELAVLRAQIADLGVERLVTVHGAVPDMPSRWSGYDVSLVTARNEAFGRVTAESLVAGTPVVGYACGGTVEILRPGGGVLVEPAPGRLADALCALAADPDRLPALRAQARARGEQLSGARSARDLVDRIESVRPGRRRPRR
ncbi:glycosyltransferase [uncultured Cellulomonas sp.]|uniref:glycosyltransferase n=1 Tax=uncultured Cellulomonas sp. TaxID=189682 RepID=UPI002601A8A3|nr:glycosyltransferase [uncultured Cellulomonas sp.]